MKPTLVIMAAGMGSRYGGLKQIDPIGPNGEIIMEYSVYDAIKAGFGKIVFVIKREIEDTFKDMVGDKVSSKIPVEYAYQSLDDLPEGFNVPEGRVKPWGTAHAVLVAMEFLHEPFAVINADDFYGYDAFLKLCSFLKDENNNAKPSDEIEAGTGSLSSTPAYASCMVGYSIENTLTEHGHVARGVCEVDSNGFLTDITERLRIGYHGDGIAFTEDEVNYTTVSAGTVVSMNMFGFPASVINEFKPKFIEFLNERGEEEKSEYLLPTLVNDLLVEGKTSVAVLRTGAKWYGVTYKDDKDRVKGAISEMVRKGEYPENLWYSS